MAESALARLPTGVDGLDAITGGGLVAGGIYVVAGRPGAGKTILTNQLAYAHARAGGRVVYATLLAETHARLLSQLRTLSFFDEGAVGRDVIYLNGLGPTVESGLVGLLQLVRRIVRDHEASLLVIDGMVTASALAPSPLEYKRFISELQTWISVVGCTVILVTSGPVDDHLAPENTMVDGIVELRCERRGLRVFRYLSIAKLRSSAFVEGSHSYLITPDGVRLYPRFEARPMPDPTEDVVRDLGTNRVPTGVPGLDEALGGGLVRGSTTLILGATGTGKTVSALHFLAEGARRGEIGLHFGFFEPPPIVLAKADRFGLRVAEGVDRGLIHVRWRRPSETLLDALGDEILNTAIERGVRRLVLDGFAGLHSSGESERVASVFAVLVAGLTAAGITVVVTDETRELFVQRVRLPTPNVSALFHNILFLRRLQDTSGVIGRGLAIIKTRDSSHEGRLLEVTITDAGLAVLGPHPAASTSTLARGKTRKTAAPSSTSKKTRPPRRRGKR